MMTEKAAERGTLKEFYQVVRYLLPEFHGFITNRAVFSLVYESLKLIPLYIVKLIVDALIEKPVLIHIAELIGLMFLVMLTLTGIEVLSSRYLYRKAILFQKEVLTHLHKKLLELPLGFHEKQRTGAMVSRINRSSGYISDLLWFMNNDIMPTIFQTITTTILLLATNIYIGLLYLFIVPWIVILITKSGKAVQSSREKYHRLYETAAGELTQSLYNVRAVKDYVQEQKEQKNYASLLGQYGKTLMKKWKIEITYISWREVLINGLRGLIMFFSVWLVIKGQITTGDVVLMFTLTEKALLNLNRLGRIYNFLGDTQESLRRARDILQEVNNIKNPSKPEHPKKKEGRIDLKNVSFSYGQEKVLDNISLSIPPKKVVAVVGASGSGKTTLIKLLTRHYDPTQGEIYLDKVNLKNLSLQELRHRVAVVSQHTELFSRTVEENIRYGRPEATKQEVINAAKKANAHQFITSFQDKYETKIGEKGIRLSGGQQQRVSIARALLKDPEIMIFDEATSSLDSESERSIQQALFAEQGKVTMIIIAHRLSTIEHADIVVVMDRGKIIEQGSHKELMEKNTLYKKMRTLQQLGQLRP
jgi:ABC-type multidrug transport system fused ATPase/permease subunit